MNIKVQNQYSIRYFKIRQNEMQLKCFKRTISYLNRIGLLLSVIDLFIEKILIYANDHRKKQVINDIM